MAETISHTWQTVEQAAVTMNVSTRTIARRLSSGGLESRVDENGRRLVLVQQINPAAAIDDTDTGDDLALAGGETAQPSEQSLSIFNALQMTVASARDDARAARRTARWAWIGVGTMAALLIAAAALVSGTVTRAVVTTDMLRDQLADTKGELKQTRAELMATRTAEAMATRDLAAARTEARTEARNAAGRVAAQAPAVIATAAPTPTPTPVLRVATPATQPTLLDRVVSLFGE